ncbi:MAG: pilus assembly protein [Gammaproteobacteria bacterium]
MRQFQMPALRSLAVRFVAVSSGCLLAITSHGQAVIDPGSQPTYTLAPYVLESTNLEARVGNEAGGTLAYRPWFENGAWTGDLIQYRIEPDGRRQFVGGTIGLYPRDGIGWNTMGSLWSARYVFPDYQPYLVDEETDGTWVCVEEDAGYWQDRNIFTVQGGAVVDFLWPNLSSGQQLAVDPVTAGSEKLQSDPYASPVLNFVRGDRSLERCKESGIFRWRYSVLGAIINSRPAYVPAGDHGLVVVGANDGMLHGFQAGDVANGGGRELWAYVPSMLLDRVGLLRVSPYRPTYFVDGDLRAANIGTMSNPQHIVAGGLGAGGKGLFVLDVTDPENPQLMLELSGLNDDHVGSAYDSRIGHIHNRPTIAQLPDGGWYLVSGNGYGSDAGTAQLVVIPLNSDGSTGVPIFMPTDTAAGNGLSGPALVDTTGDGQADYAWAGDLKGNMWRFKLKDATATVRLFNTAGNGSKPITAEPDVTRHPETDTGYMVYFGTGSLLSAADGQNTVQQSVYGVWDRLGPDTVAANRLVTQTLVTSTQEWTVPTDTTFCPTAPLGNVNQATIRLVTGSAAPVWTGTNPNLGWQVNLPRTGERLIGRPQVRAERLQFITTNPYDMADLERMQDVDAGSWILQLDLASGGNARNARPLFDLNDNCALDADDGIPTAITGVTPIPAGAFPVGVHIGPFNVAQPAFARVAFDPQLGSVVDGVYINALQLPPDDPVNRSQGPIDVTTDSPNGPAHRFVQYEPLKEPFTSRLFPEASGPTKPFIQADGLGHRVDGHSFGYNKHHGVDYVDFFELEPQRGFNDDDKGFRLDIGATYLDPADSKYKMIPPQTLSEQELNRVTEVGIDPAKEFIVVLANADLSRENLIQIGCRIWPVYQYQTLMMQHLRIVDPVARLNSLRAANLVFTLDGIRGSGTCSSSVYRLALSTTPTIRITPSERIGTYDATVASMPGCVNNTDLYVAPSGRLIHQTRKPQLLPSGEFVVDATPADLYRTDPHPTKAFTPQGANPPEWAGYRWRNGALTVQLLAANDFTLQDAVHLPRGTGQEGIDIGFGGAYAKAFNVVDGVVVPLNDGSSPPTAGAATSGLLYELSMFWNYGDLARFQTQGVGQAVYPVCVGARGYQPSVMFESEFLTPGSYKELTAGFTEDLQREYLRLLNEVANKNPEALVDLAKFFAENPNIADYNRLRHYVATSKQLNDSNLLAIDRGDLNFDLAVDGTPAAVIDIEADLLPSLGPNYQPGRRSWADITPD